MGVTLPKCVGYMTTPLSKVVAHSTHITAHLSTRLLAISYQEWPLSRQRPSEARAASFDSFSVGVALHPDGHTEAPSLESDLFYVKQNNEAGADFAITQMFFDNSLVHFHMLNCAETVIEVLLNLSLGRLLQERAVRTIKAGAMCYLSTAFPVPRSKTCILAMLKTTSIS